MLCPASHYPPRSRTHVAKRIVLFLRYACTLLFRFHPRTMLLRCGLIRVRIFRAYRYLYAGERVFRVSTSELDEALAEIQEGLVELVWYWDGSKE